jgi:pimeloyl-ACP methyl ester carboxylesterase
MSSDGLSRQSHGRSETGFSTANSIDRQLTTSANPRTASSRDPIGLKVVYRPPGDRKVDVVFVHGLGGSSRMTWSHDRNLDLFWPLTFLPLEPAINEARILTFGYNSNFGPGSGRNKMSILDFAKDLLYDLKYAQDEAMPEVEGLGMGEASMHDISVSDWTN